MIIQEADLTPAEAELRKVYAALLSEVNQARVSQEPLEMPIVHIMPRGRRVEYGWFRPGTWEKTSSKVAKSMGADQAKAVYDEVFIAGEALAWPSNKLVELLFHQLVHQRSKTSSNTTYHSWDFGYTGRRLGYADVDRHLTMGWTELKHPNGPLSDLFRRVVQTVDRKAFDVTRIEESTKVGSGKMRLWRCACHSGARVYTGAILHAVCSACNQRYRYAHKDMDNPGVRNRIHWANEFTMEDP